MLSFLSVSDILGFSPASAPAQILVSPIEYVSSSEEAETFNKCRSSRSFKKKIFYDHHEMSRFGFLGFKKEASKLAELQLFGRTVIQIFLGFPRYTFW